MSSFAPRRESFWMWNRIKLHAQHKIYQLQMQNSIHMYPWHYSFITPSASLNIHGNYRKMNESFLSLASPKLFPALLHQSRHARQTEYCFMRHEWLTNSAAVLNANEILQILYDPHEKIRPLALVRDVWWSMNRYNILNLGTNELWSFTKKEKLHRMML